MKTALLALLSPVPIAMATTNWMACYCPVLSVKAVAGWEYTVMRTNLPGSEPAPVWFTFLSFTNDQIHVPDLAAPKGTVPYYSVRPVRRFGSNLLDGVVMTGGPPCMVFAHPERWETNYPVVKATTNLSSRLEPAAVTRQANWFGRYLIDFSSRSRPAGFYKLEDP